MNSCGSSEDENEFEHWNNWQNSEIVLLGAMHSFDEGKHLKKCANNKVLTSASISTQNTAIGNWLAPVTFWKTREILRMRELALPGGSDKRKERTLMHRNSRNEYSGVTQKIPFHEREVLYKKELNLDWGSRINLYDVAKFTDGDLVWGAVHPGVFVVVKLWVNEYGHICGFAEGTISKIGKLEKSCILITKPQILRKMLNISKSDWNFLNEQVQKTKKILKFETLKNFDQEKLSNLEKLWFFLCKRRHFLSDQCMLVKLNGAVKCLKEFKILPKLIVQDIRNCQKALVL